MNPQSALFVMSVRQALPRRRTIILILIELAPMAIYLFATANRTRFAAFEGMVDTATAILFALAVPVVAMVLGASAFGVERRDQTLSFIAMRPMRRTTLAATKMVATIVAASAINLVGALALGIAHTLRFGDPAIITGLSVGVVVATALYVSVTVPLGFITDRAVIIALAYLLVFENGVASALLSLSTLSPWRIGLAAFGGLVDEASLMVANVVGSLELSVTRSVVAVIVLFVVGALITTQMLTRRDLA